MANLDKSTPSSVCKPSNATALDLGIGITKS